jgi:hypothetical protein
MSGSELGPSHLAWQDLDPVEFLWDFRMRICQALAVVILVPWR